MAFTRSAKNTSPRPCSPARSGTQIRLPPSGNLPAPTSFRRSFHCGSAFSSSNGREWPDNPIESNSPTDSSTMRLRFRSYSDSNVDETQISCSCCLSRSQTDTDKTLNISEINRDEVAQRFASSRTVEKL